MSKMGGMNVETCSQWRDAGAMTLFRRCLLGFNQRSSAATSTALTHHPSHLQTNRHPFARPYNQSPNCGTHISPAPTWTSPTSCTFLRSYSSTKIELYQAAASRLAIGVEDDTTDNSQSHGELRRRRLYCSRRCREIVPLQRLVSTPVQKVSSQQRRERQPHVQTAPLRITHSILSCRRAFRGPSHDRDQEAGWLVKLVSMRWRLCARLVEDDLRHTRKDSDVRSAWMRSAETTACRASRVGQQ
jgi:hypothetical protein